MNVTYSGELLNVRSVAWWRGKVASTVMDAIKRRDKLMRDGKVCRDVAGPRPDSLFEKFSSLGIGEEERARTVAAEETSTSTSSSSVAVECIFSRRFSVAGSILASLVVRAGCRSEMERQGEAAGSREDGEEGCCVSRRRSPLAIAPLASKTPEVVTFPRNNDLRNRIE